jgi:hypothetical protein
VELSRPVAAIPWIMFFVTAVLTGDRRSLPRRRRDHRPDRASLSPSRHGINPLLMA